jgi:hypothetical protein
LTVAGKKRCDAHECAAPVLWEDLKACVQAGCYGHEVSTLSRKSRFSIDRRAERTFKLLSKTTTTCKTEQYQSNEPIPSILNSLKSIPSAANFCFLNLSGRMPPMTGLDQAWRNGRFAPKD